MNEKDPPPPPPPPPDDIDFGIGTLEPPPVEWPSGRLDYDHGVTIKDLGEVSIPLEIVPPEEK